MRTLLIMLVVGLLIIPAISQPLQVGGNFGRTWLAQYGDRNVVRQPYGPGLWSWGTIPLGELLLPNGRLMEI